MINTSYSYADNKQIFIEVSSFHKAEPYLTGISQDTLVIFDIDSTMTTPEDIYLRRYAIKQHKDIYNKYVPILTKNQQRIFHHLLVLQSPSQLVEKGIPSLIQKIQKSGVKTLAWTSSKIDAVGTIVSSFPEWRYKELKRLGIDFFTTYPRKVVFKNFPDFGGDYTGMEKGIVYCGHQAEKGDLLKPVLQELRWIPNRIIFIDDKYENLKSLADAIQKNFPSITYIGIHYKGMDSLPIVETDVTIFTQKIEKLVEETRSITLQ